MPTEDESRRTQHTNPDEIKPTEALMDMSSILTVPARIALAPVHLTLRVLFAAGNRWLATPHRPEDDPPDLLEVDNYWTIDRALACPHAGTRCIWIA